MIKYNSDKSSKQNNYGKYYNQVLESERSNYKEVLELGIWKGASLKVWKDYFPNATIHGVDILPDCKNYEEDRVKVHIGSQEDKNHLNSVINSSTTKNFDVIIDDGSHLMGHMKASFDYLWKYVKPQGYYIIEDLGTCYDHPSYIGYKDKGGFKMINYLKSLVDEVNLCTFKDYEKIYPVANEIESIFFSRWMCFIKKK
jgi:hypothetical protein